jgi:hypothetical protein
MQATFERQCHDQGLKDLLTDSPEGFARIARVRAELLPKSAELVRRAQAAGTLAPDVDATDLALIQLMTGSVIDASRDLEPGLWHRYFGLLLRGLDAIPDGHPPLSPGPLAPEQVDTVLARSKGAHRRS